MKTLAFALLALAGCGGAMEPEDTAASSQPAGTIASSQWYVTVRASSWGCFGSMGLTIMDGKAVAGDWSCNTNLKYGTEPHNYRGPVSGTANGGALSLTAADGPSMPTAYAVSAAMAMDGSGKPTIAGTIAVGGEQATFSATGL